MRIRDVKFPNRNVGEDAGFDFFVPEFSLEFLKELKELNPWIEIVETPFYGVKLRNNRLRTTASESGIFVMPGDDILIPSGIKSSFNNNIELEVNNKSGVCRKQKFQCGACIIDSSYQGEIGIHIINYSKDLCTHLDFGQKMVQLIPKLIDLTKPEFVDGFTNPELQKSFYSEKTSRGSGGFGSTGV